MMEAVYLNFFLAHQIFMLRVAKHAGPMHSRLNQEWKRPGGWVKNPTRPSRRLDTGRGAG
jgi:hypothetical protein